MARVVEPSEWKEESRNAARVGSLGIPRGKCPTTSVGPSRMGTLRKACEPPLGSLVVLGIDQFFVVTMSCGSLDMVLDQGTRVGMVSLSFCVHIQSQREMRCLKDLAHFTHFRTYFQYVLICKGAIGVRLTITPRSFPDFNSPPSIHPSHPSSIITLAEHRRTTHSFRQLSASID